MGQATGRIGRRRLEFVEYCHNPAKIAKFSPSGGRCPIVCSPVIPSATKGHVVSLFGDQEQTGGLPGSQTRKEKTKSGLHIGREPSVSNKTTQDVTLTPG